MTEIATAPTAPDPEALEPYDHAAVEARWRRIWEERGDWRTPMDAPERPFYNLMMFPYPSAEGLHVGHIVPYSGGDTYGRWRRMQGDTVFEPMGFDAFGIHSENYAIKIGEHPAVVMRRAVSNFRDNQLKRLGAIFDWDHQVNTSDPSYYRWTQWVFLQLFKAGMAEWRDGAVVWCPSCKTVLANEQVEHGRCERCESVVETRWLRQWWLRITDVAQELLDALDDLDWSESTKLMQRNWIGRREGARITFALEGCERGDVAVFTTRPDTLYGATFVVVAADHPQLEEYTPVERRGEVNAWRNRLPGPEAEPDFGIGIDLGSWATHPLTGRRLPVWAAPYVLYDYGTGAIMAVPAHDERDHAFARAHDLEVVPVIEGGTDPQAAYTGQGTMRNSDDLDGMPSVEAKRRIVERLQNLGRGEATVTYRIRDWLVSRQRYWGAPIPIIHCTVDGQVPVPEEDLPVLLPEVADFQPRGTGVSPLAAAEEWVNVSCPVCGGPARRETDVFDTFVDSSWYHLRYPSTDVEGVAFDGERTRTWLPVDMYIGGNEHAVRHLLFARFVQRALHHIGLVDDPEPYRRFRAHGMITKDGAKMSKSRGNVVNPDDYIESHGADALRLYMLFLGPYTEGGDFRSGGIAGVTRFLHRVWRGTQLATGEADDHAAERRRHRLIRSVGDDIAGLHFNTAIAALMEFARDVDREARAGAGRRRDAETLLLLLAPFAPHITEELWQRTGHTTSVHARGGWPQHDPALATAEEVEVAVQVNGKLRATLRVPAGTPATDLEQRALALPRITEILANRPPRKVIVVVDRIVNIVI
ncbi:MAG: leucine--tRNA ligase [Candidatus Dormibacteria bacterium]